MPKKSASSCTGTPVIQASATESSPVNSCTLATAADDAERHLPNDKQRAYAGEARPARSKEIADERRSLLRRPPGRLRKGDHQIRQRGGVRQRLLIDLGVGVHQFLDVRHGTSLCAKSSSRH